MIRAGPTGILFRQEHTDDIYSVCWIYCIVDVDLMFVLYAVLFRSCVFFGVFPYTQHAHGRHVCCFGHQLCFLRGVHDEGTVTVVRRNAYSPRMTPLCKQQQYLGQLKTQERP